MEFECYQETQSQICLARHLSKISGLTTGTSPVRTRAAYSTSHLITAPGELAIGKQLRQVLCHLARLSTGGNVNECDDLDTKIRWNKKRA
jgi:hypothetical protein